MDKKYIVRWVVLVILLILIWMYTEFLIALMITWLVINSEYGIYRMNILVRDLEEKLWEK